MKAFFSRLYLHAGRIHTACAKGQGSRLYVVLDSPERNIERVRLRVQKGGHAVPEEKIRKRYAGSLRQLPWFLDQADSAWIFDNSGPAPKQIGKKQNGLITLDDHALIAIRRAVESIESG